MFDGFDEPTVAEQLKEVELYASQQGDKFHPFSDTLLAIFEQAEQDAQDELTSYVPDSTEALELEAEAQERLRGELIEALVGYEAAPASPYHSYHTDRIRGMLNLTEEDAD